MERCALLAIVRVSAAHRTAETRLMRKMQDVSYFKSGGLDVEYQGGL
jgi:hypothetical protein